MDSINNVCRVCLTTANLKWIFDRKLYCVQKINLKNLIFTITGVEIVTDDIISQKICTRCYRTSIKMYQFRMRARKNNKILKERYNGMLKTSPIEHEIPNTGVTVEDKVEPEMEIKEAKEPNYKLHQSVRDVLKKFPRLKLPTPWLISSIEPCIILERETVDNFLKEVIKNKQIRAGASTPDHILARENTSSASVATDPLYISSTETDSGDDSTNKKIIMKNSSASEIVCDNSNKGDSDYEVDVIDDITVEPEREFSSHTRMKDSSQGPFPKEKPIGESLKGSCQDKSIPLLVCSICNSVHDNVKKLERHQLRHLRCQFCRSMFKTIRSMEAHIKSSCAIKNMMNNLPSVKLQKIELNQRIRTKYPDAFIDYPPIPRLQLGPRSADETSEHDDDVIEILSDDDDTLTPNTPEKKIVPVRNITQSKINSFFLPTNPTATKKASSTVPSVKSTSSIISTALPISSIASADSLVISRGLSPAHVVEPDIRIENSTVIGKIGPAVSDIECVKKMLTDRTALKREGFSQTELLCRTSVCANKSDGTIELKHMRDLLLLYRIPFLFTKGDFRARYDYNSKPQQPNELRLWNDLFPVDVKLASEFSNSDDSARDRMPVITSEVATESFSTPGITDNTETTIDPDPLDSSFSVLTNLRTYSRNNRFSNPVNSSSVSSQQQVMPSNSEIDNMDPCSQIPKHILVRTNTAVQHSTSNTIDSSIEARIAMYLQSNCPTPVLSEANTTGLPIFPVSYLNDMRNPPNVGSTDLAISKMCPLVSHISIDNTSNVGYTDSARYHSHDTVEVQNKLPNLGHVTTTSSSNKAGSALGSIRVKSLRDLT